VGTNVPTAPTRAGELELRTARLTDTQEILDVIEDAGEMFNGLGLADESLEVSFPLGKLKRLIRKEQVWVCARGSSLAGAIILSALRKTAYVEELAVRRDCGRRGIGTRLVGRGIIWACEKELDSIYLSTFASVPWNAPFYRKLGFTDIDPDRWTSAMRRIRRTEEAQGLKVSERVFMQRILTR
jgi:N-acetylglutamate synthase-like GNAT family acetyltransferase